MVTSWSYADAAGALLIEGYEPSEVTTAAVVHRALDHWLREQIEFAVSHHAATTGSDHQEDDRCESWYALHNALTHMHDGSYRFVHALLDPPRLGAIP
jgi:hypothetical protein